nr:potassium transporter TrkG [Motilimonas cestriensis]
MSFPIMGAGLSFIDALFEAISGVTTTGLSTQSSLLTASPTFLFARAWMQWYGGLGIVVLSLALVMQPGILAKGLAVEEVEQDNLVGSTRAHARQILMVYAALTLLGVSGAWLAGIGFFNAVLYTFAAVSTGGFAPMDGSLAALSWPLQAGITLLCFAGAIPLTLYYQVVKQRKLSAVGFLQLCTLMIACALVAIAVATTMTLTGDMSWSQVLQHAPLLAISAQSSAGFSSMPTEQLDAGSKLMLIFSMLIGGSAGSTAGGLKLLRLLIVISVLRLIILRTCLPKHAVVEPRLAGRRLGSDEIQVALLLMLLFVAVVALSWLPFVVMGYDPLDALFEVVSATGTVGLSVGVSSASLPPLLKGILCADMLLGRLEIMAWLVVIYPRTWFGRRMEDA